MDKQTEEELRTSLRQQRAVADFSGRALFGTDFTTLMNEAVSLVADTLRVEYSEVWELLSEGGRLLLRAGVGWKEGLVGGATASVSRASQAGYTLESGAPVVVENLRTEESFSDSLLSEHGVASGASVIIQSGSLQFGVLGAHTVRRRSFTTDEVDFLLAIAHVLAGASERRRAENQLTLIRTAFESASDAIKIADLNGKSIYHNRAFRDLLEYTEEELTAAGGATVLFGDAGVAREVFAALESGQPYAGEVAMRTRGGRMVEIALRTAIIRDALGGPQALIAFCTDITERKRAEEALRVSEERFFKAFNASPDPQSINRYEDGRYLYVNDSFVEASLYAREEVIGRNTVELGIWDDPADSSRLIRMLEKQGRIYKEEVRFRLQSGAVCTGLFSAEVIEVNGERCILSLTNDITDRKRAEEELLKSEERYRNLVENSQGLICTHDMEGTLLSVNPAAAHLAGYQPSEMVGRNLREFLMPGVRPLFGAYLERIRHEAVVSGLLRGLTRDGQERVWAYRNVRFEESGKPPYVLGHAIDVTERKQAEEALRETEARLRTVVANSPIVFFAVDREGVFTLSEGKGLEAVGLQPGEVVGQSVFDVYGDQPEILSNIRRALAGEDFTAPLRVGELTFEVWYSPRRRGGGEVAGVIGVATNITERTQAVEALRISEERFFKAFNASPAPITITRDEDGRYLYVNESFLKITGFTRHEVLKRNARELGLWANPQDSARLTRMLEEQGKISNEEIDFRLKSGEVRTGLFSAEIIEVDGERCILSLVSDITDSKRLEAKLFVAVDKLSHQIPGALQLIGASPEIERLNKLIQQVAIGKTTTVLLRGETGTGKELVAKLIHEASQHAGRFVAVNCGSLATELFGSELFGHEKGAFTDAVARKIGRFELAAGGTLLLDEVGELKPDQQSSLLRVLEEREFQRVGGTENIEFTARVVVATNRDLEAAVNAGRFRQDLYHRLDVFPVEVAPLRERVEDILPLAEHFIALLGEQIGLEGRTLTLGARNKLLDYDWPGNVRQLRNAIERALLRAETARISPENIGLEYSPKAAAPRDGPEDHPNQDPIASLAELKRTQAVAELAALEAIIKHYGSQKAAGAEMGISDDTLSRQLKRLKRESEAGSK